MVNEAGGLPAPEMKLSPASLKWSKSVNDVPVGVADVTRNLTSLPFSRTLVGSTVMVAVGWATTWTWIDVETDFEAESTTVRVAVKIPVTAYWCPAGTQVDGSPTNSS